MHSWEQKMALLSTYSSWGGEVGKCVKFMVPGQIEDLQKEGSIGFGCLPCRLGTSFGTIFWLPCQVSGTTEPLEVLFFDWNLPPYSPQADAVFPKGERRVLAPKAFLALQHISMLAAQRISTWPCTALLLHSLACIALWDIQLLLIPWALSHTSMQVGAIMFHCMTQLHQSRRAAGPDLRPRSLDIFWKGALCRGQLALHFLGDLALSSQPSRRIHQRACGFSEAGGKSQDRGAPWSLSGAGPPDKNCSFFF